MINIETYVPKSLNTIVKSFWFINVDIGDGLYEEDIIPDGHHEIIFYLGGSPVKRQMDSGQWVNEPKALIAGQTLKSHKIKMSAGTCLFGIRFYPNTLYALCGIPMHHINTGILPLADVLNPEGLWYCISDDHQSTFNNVERYLRERISFSVLSNSGFRHVSQSLKIINSFNGRLNIGQMIDKAGVSAKYFDDLFKRYVGITPKKLADILRFNKLISYKLNNPEKTLTTCAYACGYYDQSHLIKAFQQFTDNSARKYFENEQLVSNQFATL